MYVLIEAVKKLWYQMSKLDNVNKH